MLKCDNSSAIFLMFFLNINYTRVKVKVVLRIDGALLMKINVQF